MTRTEAQNVVRALVEVINCATSPTPTSPPSSSSHSRTSVDSAGALSVTSCSTCSFHSNRLVRGSPGSTATSTTAVSLMAASAPVSTNVAAAVSPVFASPAHLIRAPHGYHIPATNADGPFYVVARGRNLGIFSGWLVFCFWTSSTSLLICLTQGDRLSFSYWGQSRCVLTCSQCCRGTREDECGQERSVCFVFDLNIVQRHFPHTLPSSLLRCM